LRGPSYSHLSRCRSGSRLHPGGICRNRRLRTGQGLVGGPVRATALVVAGLRARTLWAFGGALAGVVVVVAGLTAVPATNVLRLAHDAPGRFTSRMEMGPPHLPAGGGAVPLVRVGRLRPSEAGAISSRRQRQVRNPALSKLQPG
jgi:hypothetical protein